MDEITMSNGEIVSMLFIIALTFIVAYSIGFNSGKAEGFKHGFATAKARYLNRFKGAE